MSKGVYGDRGGKWEYYWREDHIDAETQNTWNNSIVNNFVNYSVINEN